MLEALGIANAIAELFNQLKGLASGGKQRRRDDEYRQEFERIWSQIALLQNQFFHVLMNQSIVTSGLQARVDELKSTVGSLQTNMSLLIQSGLMQQPTEQVRQRIFDLATDAEQKLKALPLPLPSVDEPSPDPTDSTPGPFDFTPPPLPLPPPPEPMSPQRRLMIMIRQQITSAAYFHLCTRYAVHDSWILMAFTSDNDPLIHALAIQGENPQTAVVRYYRHAQLTIPADGDRAWDDIFALFERILNTRFVELPDAGINNLVARIERGDFDTMFVERAMISERRT